MKKKKLRKKLREQDAKIRDLTEAITTANCSLTLLHQKIAVLYTRINTEAARNKEEAYGDS